MPGPMQFGAVNNAGDDRTELRSTGFLQLGPPGGDAFASTLRIRNPLPGVFGRPDAVVVALDAIGRNGVSGTSTTGGGGGDAAVEGTALGPNSNGVIGIANNGLNAFGVWGQSGGGFAGFFSGKVQVTGQLIKTGIFFQIDHPRDPENKYLSHSGVESDDMKNVYDGIAHLDDEGAAWVELPEWFGELNRDYRYQLTAIGGPAPDLHIAEEIYENRFRIAGGPAGMSVSWQVTGIRKDAWAERNRIVVEEDKPEEARGTYLHPEAFGQPETRGQNYSKEEALRARLAEPPEVNEEPADST